MAKINLHHLNSPKRYRDSNETRMRLEWDSNETQMRLEWEPEWDPIEIQIRLEWIIDWTKVTKTVA